jgi:hypothetical protein
MKLTKSIKFLFLKGFIINENTLLKQINFVLQHLFDEILY